MFHTLFLHLTAVLTNYVIIFTLNVFLMGKDLKGSQLKNVQGRPTRLLRH